MERILQSAAVANLPVTDLDEELHEFVKPMRLQLPENRLREVAWSSPANTPSHADQHL